MRQIFLNSAIIIVVAVAFVLVAACGNRTSVTTSKSPGSVGNEGLKQTVVAKAGQEPNSVSTPKNGYVPDEQTAIAIAVAVWNGIYGRDHIEKEKPFHAILQNRIWTVTGSLSPGYDGGVALAEIAQDDGRILRVIHGQ